MTPDAIEESGQDGERLPHLAPPEFNMVQSLLGVFWSVWFARLSTQSLESTGYGWLPAPVSLDLLKIVYVIGITVAITLLVLGSRKLQQVQQQMEQMDELPSADIHEYTRLLRQGDRLTAFLGAIVVALPFYSIIFFDGINIHQAILSALLFLVFLFLVRSYR